MNLKTRNSVSSSSLSARFGACSICKEGLLTDITAPRCGHVFHEECIGRWLENSTLCPVCRSDIATTNRVKIFPGTTCETEALTEDVWYETSHLLTAEELQTLTLEASKRQTALYSQINLLSEKLAEQENYIEGLKGRLEEREGRFRTADRERDKLTKELAEITSSHAHLQEEMGRLEEEKITMGMRVEEVDLTVDYLDTLVEQHKADFQEARSWVGTLEMKLEQLQTSCQGMETTINAIDLIRYEVDTQADRPVEDFIEDLVQENNSLKIKVAETDRTLCNKECEILDLEMNVDGLKETLKEVRTSFSDQNSESHHLEESLRTMQRLFKDQSVEMATLKSEREDYEGEIKGMLHTLHQTEETAGRMDRKRRESEALNSSYHSQIAQGKVLLERLQREKEDAEMVVRMKGDVINSLQASVRACSSRLDKFTSDESMEGEEGSDPLILLETRLKKLILEMEEKETMLIQLMTEKSALELETVIKEEIQDQELMDKITDLEDKMRRLERELAERETSTEEKEMVIAHLVNVINRYAYNDRDEGSLKRVKKQSEPAIPSSSVALEQDSMKSKRTSSPGLGGRAFNLIRKPSKITET